MCERERPLNRPIGDGACKGAAPLHMHYALSVIFGQERERSREQFGRPIWTGAREDTDFLLPKLVVLPEKGRDSRSDGWMDLMHGARSMKGGWGRGHALCN